MPVAVVTGAGGGLGRAIALDLASRGYLIQATDIDAGAAAGTAAEIGAGASSSELDVTDQEACHAIATAAATRSGTLDLWGQQRRRAGHRPVLGARRGDDINALGTMPMLEDKLNDPAAASSFSGQLLTPGEVATAVGKLTERPRPLLVLPRWRGPLLRIFDLFPRLALRLLPLVMRDARRRQRRYKRLIESGKWP